MFFLYLEEKTTLEPFAEGLFLISLGSIFKITLSEKKGEVV